MKTRRVFSTPDLAAAQRAMGAALLAGVDNENIFLIARSDIEMDDIPDDRMDATSDFIPAALRGAGFGGAIGLIGGLIAVAIPAIGITLAGAGLIAVASAAVAGWSAALMGSAMPNPVRQKFEHEIAAGKILVVIDDATNRASLVNEAIAGTGALLLPFNEPSVLV